MRGAENVEQTARALANSGLIVHNLVSNRIKGYAFDWDKLLTMKGRSGPYVQYQHARLCSLVRRAKRQRQLEPTADVFYELLLDDYRDVSQLVLQIARFDDALARTYANLEPHFIVQYLFELWYVLHIHVHVLTCTVTWTLFAGILCEFSLISCRGFFLFAPEHELFFIAMDCLDRS